MLDSWKPASALSKILSLNVRQGEISQQLLHVISEKEKLSYSMRGCAAFDKIKLIKN